MTTNGTETSNQTKYKTTDGLVFNEYINAFVHQAEENKRTTAGCSVTVVDEKFKEYYY